MPPEGRAARRMLQQLQRARGPVVEVQFTHITILAIDHEFARHARMRRHDHRQSGSAGFVGDHAPDIGMRWKQEQAC